MPRAILLVSALTLVLTGCISALDSEPLTAASLPVGLSGIVTTDGAFKASAPARWVGANLTALDQGGSNFMGFGDPTQLQFAPCWFAGVNCPDWQPPACEVGKNCERREFTVSAPESADFVRTLEVSIRWPTTFQDWYMLRIEDEAGAVVAEGRNGLLGSVALVESPKAGKYAAVVVQTWGEGAYEGVIQLEEKPKETTVRELLPNLVTIPPTDLRILTPGNAGGSPIGGMLPGGGLMDLTGSKGCAPDERIEDMATRCLRFSNAVANVGEGALEVFLSYEAGATHAAGGKFVQRVYKTDGTFTEVPSGAAEWHAVHGHWHNAAANAYTVHKYDWDTKARGEEVGRGNKGGICFADVGMIDLGLPHTWQPSFFVPDCYDPNRNDGWKMGLAPNWYDLYYWTLSDQYVDLTGVEDGVYELVTITNQNGALQETDLTDNEGSTVFRLAGDAIEVLTPEPYHKAQDGA